MRDLTYRNMHGRNLMNSIYVTTSKKKRCLLSRLEENHLSLFNSWELTLSQNALRGGADFRAQVECCRRNFCHPIDFAHKYAMSLYCCTPQERYTWQQDRDISPKLTLQKLSYARQRQKKWLKRNWAPCIWPEVSRSGKSGFATGSSAAPPFQTVVNSKFGPWRVRRPATVYLKEISILVLTRRGELNQTLLVALFDESFSARSKIATGGSWENFTLVLRASSCL